MRTYLIQNKNKKRQNSHSIISYMQHLNKKQTSKKRKENHSQQTKMNKGCSTFIKKKYMRKNIKKIKWTKNKS